MSDDEEDIESCKVVLIGESGVGKTSIISQFINETFQVNMESTSGATFSSKVVTLSNKNKIKLEIWDTAGQERYRALTKMFYKDAAAAILVCDITDKNSFIQIKEYWVDQIKQNNDNIILIIVANKSDLYEKEAIDEKEVRNYANELNANFIVCSALNRSGIEDIFVAVGNNYFEKKYNKNNNSLDFSENKNAINDLNQSHDSKKIKLKLDDVKKQVVKKKNCC
jgi:Ras-related protein Rab-11A